MTDKIGFEISRTWFSGAVLAVLVQFGGWVWWASAQAVQLNAMEGRMVRVETKLDDFHKTQLTSTERIVKIEDKAATVVSSAEKLEAHLASIETYLNTMIREGKK